MAPTARSVVPPLRSPPPPPAAPLLLLALSLAIVQPVSVASYVQGNARLSASEPLPDIPAGQASFNSMCSPAVVAARLKQREPRMAARYPDLLSYCTPVPGRFNITMFCDPTYLVIGIMKAGTSSFFHYANHHENIHIRSRENHRWEWTTAVDIPQGKRPIFSTSVLSSNGTVKFLGEHSENCNPDRGPGKKRNKWCGNKDYPVDFSPKLVLKTFDNGNGQQPQFVVLLRDPAKRDFSNYLHFYAFSCNEIRGDPLAQELCFDQVVREMLDTFLTCVGDKTSDLDTLVRCAFEPKTRMHYARRLVTWSLYSIHLAHWMKFFPASRFCLIDEEEWETVDEGMRSFETCLGLTHQTGYPEERFNQAKFNTTGMLPQTAQHLRAFFDPFNRLLAHLNPDACNFSWVRRAFNVK